MEKINEYLLLEIFKKLSFTKKILFNNVNKKLKNITNNDINNILEKNKEWISENFNSKIINLFGGLDFMKYLPHIKWRNKYIGHTDYIDNIKPLNVKHGVMLGIDNFNRPFISLKTIDEYNKKSVDVIFQRYSNNKNTWSNGQYNSSGFINESGHFLVNNIFQHKYLENNIKSLLKRYNFLGYKNKFSEILYYDYVGNVKKKNLILNL